MTTTPADLSQKYRRVKPALHVVVKETGEKLLYQIEDELQIIGMAHWREGRDEFYYGRFALDNAISRWDRGDDDL